MNRSFYVHKNRWNWWIFSKISVCSILPNHHRHLKLAPLAYYYTTYQFRNLPFNRTPPMKWKIFFVIRGVNARLDQQRMLNALSWFWCSYTMNDIREQIEKRKINTFICDWDIFGRYNNILLCIFCVCFRQHSNFYDCMRLAQHSRLSSPFFFIWYFVHFQHTIFSEFILNVTKKPTANNTTSSHHHIIIFMVCSNNLLFISDSLRIDGGGGMKQMRIDSNCSQDITHTKTHKHTHTRTVQV